MRINASVTSSAARYPSWYAADSSPNSSESLAASIRQASTTMSWVEEANATSTASRPTAVSPCLVPQTDSPTSPIATSACVSSIQLRRRPNRAKIGASVRSTTGAQRNFSEYARPTQERNPIALRVVPSSRSQYPRVLPVSKKGSPEENPSASITATFGCPSDEITSRLRLRVVAACTMCFASGGSEDLPYI
jgi:hypothetical protein